MDHEPSIFPESEASDSSTLFSDGFDGSNDLNLHEQSILLSPKSFGVWMKMMDDIINGLNMLQKRGEEMAKQVYILGEINRKEKAQHEELDVLRQITLLLMPLYIRALLDKASEKIPNHVKSDSWEDLHQGQTAADLSELLYTRLANAEHIPSREAMCLYNNVHRSGNSVVHTVKPEEIRAAVVTKQLGTTEGRWIEQIYTFTYGEPV